MTNAERDADLEVLYDQAMRLVREEHDQTPVQPADSWLLPLMDAKEEKHSKAFLHMAKATFTGIATRIGEFGAGSARAREAASAFVD